MDNWRTVRKKPTVVEVRDARPGETVETLEGTLTASPGDLIIRGVKGEVYPIARDIFEQTYVEAPGEIPTRLTADGGG